MGMGCEKMFDAFDYTEFDFDELKAKYCPAPRKINSNIEEIVGGGLTDKFSMFRISKNDEIELSRPFSVAIVTAGAGYIENVAVQKGDRLLVSGNHIATFGKTLETILCV